MAEENTIVVNNISAQVELAHLKELFECCGTISDAKMVTGPGGRQQALITYTESAHAKAATFLTDTPLGDTKLQVTMLSNGGPNASPPSAANPLAALGFTIPHSSPPSHHGSQNGAPDPTALANAFAAAAAAPLQYHPPQQSVPFGGGNHSMGANQPADAGAAAAALIAAAQGGVKYNANPLAGEILNQRAQMLPINVAAAVIGGNSIPRPDVTPQMASMGAAMMLPVLGGIALGGSAGALPPSAIPGYIGGGAALNPMASGPNAPPAFLVQQNMATIATGGLVMGPRGGIDTASLLAQQRARDEVLRTIQASNVASVADEDQVRKYFNTFGHVVYVKFTGATEDGNKIVGVEFTSSDGAKKAIAASGQTMMGQPLTVIQAPMPIQKDARDDSRGGGGSSSSSSSRGSDAMRRVREAQMRIATKVGETVSAATGVAALNAATSEAVPASPSSAAASSPSSSSRRDRSRSRERSSRSSRRSSRSRSRSRDRASRSSRSGRRSRSRSRDRRRSRSRSRDRRSGGSSSRSGGGGQGNGGRAWSSRGPAPKKKEQPDTSNMFWDGFQWNLKIPGVLESRGPIPMPGQRFGLH